MKSWVKICGLRDVPMIEVALDAGADAIGLVFAESPRAVGLEQARVLAEAVRGQADLVAVLRHPAPDLVDRVLHEIRPTWLQTDAVDFESLSLPEHSRALPVYRDSDPIDAALATSVLLYEGANSGTGETADWARAEQLAPGRQLVLAGGLSPDNVVDAIQAVRPAGVDVSSGVERERGIKDPQAIQAFVAAARTAFETMEKPNDLDD